MSPRVECLADLEGQIASLKGAAALLTLVREEVLKELQPAHARAFKISASVTSAFKVYTLTDFEDDALHHALLHIEGLIGELHKAFHSALHGAGKAERQEGAAS